MTEMPPVCDYEGSDYRTRFWENQGRDYEDQVERIALRRLMPARGQNLLDVGAGFGRLADEYDGYQRVVLFDYSRSLLRQAQQHLGHDPRFLFVAGNWYQMPFVDGLFDTIVQVRTLHHAADAPALFQQLAQVSRPNGVYVLEFASKQNLKAILRYLARRQEWSPFDKEPVEFVKLNFDFHPSWICGELQNAGFCPHRTLTVSHFRLPQLKNALPTGLLTQIDRLIQFTGRWWQLTPSVFVRNRNRRPGATAARGTFFACPYCRTPLAGPEEGLLDCSECGTKWRFDHGLYDFKEPVAGPEP